MPFQLSPGVNVTEIDLTTIVPAVATSDGAIAGIFNWGPVGERMLIDSEQKLLTVFGKPNSNNAETWFTAANFLSYSNRLYVVRAANTTTLHSRNDVASSAYANGDSVWTYTEFDPSGIIDTGTTHSAISLTDANMSYSLNDQVYFENDGNNDLDIGLTDKTFYYISYVDTDKYALSATYGGANIILTSTGPSTTYYTSKVVLDYTVKNSVDYQNRETPFPDNMTFVAKYPGAIGNSLKISIVDSPEAYSSAVATDGNINHEFDVIQVDAGYDTGTIKAGKFNVQAELNIHTGSSTANVMFTPYSFTTEAGAVGDNPDAVTFDGTLQNAADYSAVWAGNLVVGDYLKLGNTSIGVQSLKIANIGESVQQGIDGYSVSITFEHPYRLHTNFVANTTVNSELTRTWEFYNVVDNVPQASEYSVQFGDGAIDGVHVVISDAMGMFTGVPGTILETYNNLSRATDAKGVGGGNIYWKDVINQSSQYVWVANAPFASGLASELMATGSTAAHTYMFGFGTDGYRESNAPLGVIASGSDHFVSAEDVDISLILQGKPIAGSTTDNASGLTINNFQLANYLIDNIVEQRKDCVAFVSPDDTLISAQRNNEATAIVAWRNAVHDSSYAVMDSGYKYQYDRYNDIYRWIPMNGDTGGLCARTDNQRDPWWSPAGFNRGQIKNLVKLRFNPRKADRDVMYKNGVNPVVSFPGQGTVLYGDKTLQSKPSAFDRINVRRLFIVIEKAISTASKFTLFEFNDEFTRAQFKNLINPYLRDVQGRRGITDFLVVCDGTNNTPERVDRNEFWGDIYIKPARSINFIQLNFVAVRTGVQFSEVVGQF